MVKLAAMALTSVVGIAGMAWAVPALADPCVTVGIPVASGPAPYLYARGSGYWRRDFYRDHFRRYGHFDHYRR